MARILIFLLCLWLPVAAFAQNDDRDTLTAFLEDNLSANGRKVTVTGFSGAFSSQASIETLTIADDEGVWITLSNVLLDWSRAALLSGRVDITELSAEKIVIDRAPKPSANALPAAESSGFALPELPVSIKVGRLAAARIELGPTILGSAVVGTLEASAELAGGEGNAALKLTRLDHGPTGTLDLSASYTNATKTLVMDLTAAEGAGGIAAKLLDIPGAPSVFLAIKGQGPLDDFAADIQLQTDNQDRLAGTVTLTGQSDGAQLFKADIGGDLAPLFLPEYAEFFGPSVALKVEGQRKATGPLDISLLSVQTRALSLDGAALFASDGLPQRFTLTGRVGLADGSPLLLPLSGDIQTRINSADIRIGFDAAKGDGWTGAVTLTGLDRSDLGVERAILSGSGRINRRTSGPGGPVLGGTFDFDATNVVPADTALSAAIGRNITGRAVLDWQPGGSGLRIGKLALNGADYSASFAGRIGDLESGFRVKGKLDARYGDLSRLSALSGRNLRGSVSLSGNGEGSPLGGDFDLDADILGNGISIDIAEADNLLRGSSAISISAKRDETGLELRSLDLSADRISASASGRLASKDSTIATEFGLPDLSVLGPGYSGALNATAQMQGALDAGRLVFNGTGRNLAIGQPQADGLLAGESILGIAVEIRDGQYQIETASLKNPQITTSVSGYYDPTGSDLKATATLPNLAALGGGYRGALTAAITAIGTQLDGKVSVEGSGQNLAIGQAQADRLLAGTSTGTTRLAIKDRKLVIESAKIENPQLRLDASGSVTDALRQLTFDGRLANMQLIVPDFPGPLTLSGTAKEDASGFDLDLTGTGPGGVDARISGRLASNLSNANLAIAGTAQAALANVFLGNRAVSGLANYDLRLNGPLALSSLSGQVSLADGRFSDPTLPFSLQGIGASANLNGSSAALTANATATSGGQIGVNGSIGLTAPFNGDLAVTLGNLVVKDPDLYQTILNGTLNVRGPLTGGATIGGTIAVGETELRVPDTGLGGVGTIPDLTHVNEPARVRQTRAKAGLLSTDANGGSANSRPFALDLLIEAPARIFLRGRGLDAELGGRIRLGGTTDNVIPSGRFDLIRGRLDILGKRLNLTRARLLLQGSLEPYVEITASNESDGITSAINITGSISNPVVTFSSNPELPQEEVLSRLLFGRGLQNISALQAAQLANAVATLAGKGGEGIIGNLRSGFGLDDLDLVTDADGNASLRAGKYITENVYTEVEVDQQGRSKINLNLDIKQGVTLRGSVGGTGEAGIGIFVQKDY